MSAADPATSGGDLERTEVGSVFVSNYPPYSAWQTEQVAQAARALDSPPRPDTPLGLYLHVPFCRKRCKFCYFKVYTEKTAAEVSRYLDALVREVALFMARPALGGRRPEFVYVGGGTPSFISARHLRALMARLRDAIDLDTVREFTFECEPGTLTRPKLEAIREIGVSRLSLGVENFDDRVLEENGRAHTSKEIRRVMPWIREIGFEQLNVDLIAGMVGETWEKWKATVNETIELDADSVTVYQMELPYNTVYSQRLLEGSGEVPVADWATKRDWHDHVFARLEEAGYEPSSGYTMVKPGGRFVYRDSVWRGCDLLGAGVASFSHLSGVHFQNHSGLEPYLARIEQGELALERALATTDRERMTRELILQLKLGRIDLGYFRDKFEVEVTTRFGSALERLADRGMLTVDESSVRLTRTGLLRVDTLLPEFYESKYQGARYT